MASKQFPARREPEGDSDCSGLGHSVGSLVELLHLETVSFGRTTPVAPSVIGEGGHHRAIIEMLYTVKAEDTPAGSTV